MENIDALRTFNDKFLAGRGYRPYLIKGKDTYTGQDVSLLTRLDPQTGSIDRYDREGTSGPVRKAVSKNYFAKIEVSNTKIALIGLHFLAQPLREDRRPEREAQADAIRSLALQLRDEGFWLIIMGDYNDFDGDIDSRDHVDSMPITNVLHMIREMKPTDPSDDLINAVSSLPKAKRYTAFYDANDNGEIEPMQEYTSIDHILLSSGLASKVNFVDIPHTHDPRKVTDHFPVVVHLDFSEDTTATTVPAIKITSLLPNPPGDENQAEEVTIRNFGTQDVNLSGWMLKDLAAKSWSLDSLGTIHPGEAKTIRRNGQPMTLNNNGDTIDLVDRTGKIIQTITYPQVDEGEVVTPAH